MNITVIRRAVWAVAVIAFAYMVFAYWEWRPLELVIAAGVFVILIPVDMALAREEHERRLPRHGPVRKWGYHEDSLWAEEYSRLAATQSFRPRIVAGVLPAVPWWRRMYRRLARVVAPWWVAAWMPLLLIPAGLWLAPIVHADTIDDQAYISVLDDNGVYYSSEQAAIDTAHAICNAFDAGRSFRQVLHAAVTGGFTQTDAASEIGAAIGIYCAENAYVLRAGTVVA